MRFATSEEVLIAETGLSFNAGELVLNRHADRCYVEGAVLYKVGEQWLAVDTGRGSEYTRRRLTRQALGKLLAMLPEFGSKHYLVMSAIIGDIIKKYSH